MKTILIIGHQWPEPNASAAGSRMLQLIEALKVGGWSIHFACATQVNDHAASLQGIGVLVSQVQLNDSSFDAFVSELNPAAVMYDRFMTEEQFGWRVAKACPNALRILDTEDLHCLRHARHEALKKGGKDFTPFLHNDLAKREIAAILRCDLSLIISSFEMALLTDHFNVDPALLLHLPFMLDPVLEQEQAQWKSFEERNHMVTIGNFLHAPNADAVRYLKLEIWPRIRKQLPKAQMHVYGAHAAQRDLQLHDESQGFFVHGKAESACEVIRNARVLLAPLRFGAGLKGKLVEAMQVGTPSVTTSIGSEAMHDGFSWPGFIADDPQAFADRAVQLHQDEALWKTEQRHALSLLSCIYSKDDLSKSFNLIINGLFVGVNAHRERNFLGSMLHFHTLRSTEFMSRWIEAKEKAKTDKA